MAQTVNLYFDGVEKECTVEVDRNGEFVCTAGDGSFIKFPKGSVLKTVAKAHNKANSAPVDLAEEPVEVEADDPGDE